MKLDNKANCKKTAMVGGTDLEQLWNTCVERTRESVEALIVIAQEFSSYKPDDCASKK
jgi:hypothetical protein